MFTRSYLKDTCVRICESFCVINKNTTNVLFGIYFFEFVTNTAKESS